MSQSEEELIQGLLRKQKWAQEEVYSLFYPRLMGNLIKSYGIERKRLIEEAIQDSFLIVYSKISQYSWQGSLSGWIWSICRNQFLNKLRAETKMMQHGQYVNKPILRDIWYAEETPMSENTEAVIDLEIVQKWAKLLLTEKNYELLTKHAEGYSYTELSLEIDRKRCVVSQRCDRAKLKIKKHLNGK